MHFEDRANRISYLDMEGKQRKTGLQNFGPSEKLGGKSCLELGNEKTVGGTGLGGKIRIQFYA